MYLENIQGLCSVRKRNKRKKYNVGKERKGRKTGE